MATDKEPAKPKKNTRFLLIDALRGIAALIVVFFHCNAAVIRTCPDWVPEFLKQIFLYGYLGVDIFFVISGFVIAFSVRSGDYTFPYLGRFALRRSIRLDPPYWITIALEMLAIKLSLMFFPDIKEALPSLKKIIAHLFYAQELTGQGNIIEIFWTLCYEIQFYIFMIILLMMHQKLSRFFTLRMMKHITYTFLAVLFIVSVLERFTLIDIAIPGLFLNRWFQFSMGMFLWFYASGKTSWHPIVISCSIVVLFVIFGYANLQQLVAVATCALLFVAIKKDALSTWLRYSVFQFLGKISYSLYLIHGVIAWRLVGMFQNITDVTSPLTANLVVLTAVVISIASATVLWWIAEKPSMNFSKKIKLPVKTA